jgi:enamidase
LLIRTATGNTARMRALDCGLFEVGRAADFVIMDKAQHSTPLRID